jgi:hypothetical protein
MLLAAVPAVAQNAVAAPGWVPQSPASSPPARLGAAMVYDGTNNNVVLFGGSDGSNPLGDTWTWNGANWTLQSPATSPSPRTAPSMVYDAALGYVLLFGGYDGTHMLQDTWGWNGSTWTQLFSIFISPPARDGAQMAYDATNGNVVLFGGTDGTNNLNDTWIWSGAAWTPLSPATPPSPRLGPSMAYDAATGNVVLFGGFDGTNFLQDTWAWNGSTWALKSNAGPSGRFNPAMVYAASTGNMVLFGGFDGNNFFADTWTWDGSKWTQQASSASAPGRTDASAAYDAATAKIVLFGGFNGGRLQDTWTYPGPAWLGSVNVGSSAQATVTFTFTAGGSIASVAVLTQGAPNLDFTDLGTGTCDTQGASHVYNAGDTCTVNVRFAPQYAGSISGAVTLNGAQSPFATAWLEGIGIAPQAVFSPAATWDSGNFYPSALDSSPQTAVIARDRLGNIYDGDGAYPSYFAVGEIPWGCTSPSCVMALGGNLSNVQGLAVDGAGNVYAAASSAGVYPGVKEIPRGCVNSATCVITLGGGFGNPNDVAVDSSGNVYVADLGNHAVKEMPPGCASSACVTTLGGGFSGPDGIAVDGSGNIYVADGGDAIKEMPPGCTSSACVTMLGSGDFTQAYGVAVDGVGNVYVSDYSEQSISEIPVGCTAPQCSVSISSASQGAPWAIRLAVDGTGNIYVPNGVYLHEIQRASPASLSFATTPRGQTSIDSPQTVTIESSGNSPVNFSSVIAVAYDPNFPEAPGVDTDCANGTVLSPGNFCTLSIDFTPQAAVAAEQLLKGKIGVSYNAMNGPLTVVNVSGNEVAAPASLTSPSPSSALGGATTFSWNSGDCTNVELWIGTSAGAYDLYSSGVVPSTVTSESVNIPTNGKAVYVRLWGELNHVWQYKDYDFTEQLAQAALTSPTPGTNFAGPNVTFTWNAVAGASFYQLDIGTSPGLADVYSSYGTTATSATATNLPLSFTETLYVRLYTGYRSAMPYYDYVFYPASPTLMASPTPNSVLNGPSVVFKWGVGSGSITGCRLIIGNLYDSGVVKPNLNTVTSLTVPNLPTNGQSLLVRLYTYYASGQAYSDYFYTAATQAALTSPKPTSVLAGPKVTFTWSAATGAATGYILRIGTTVGANDLYASGPITATSATPTNLPINGKTVYVRLITNYGSQQGYYDYVFTAAAGPTLTGISPASGASGTSVNVTLTGTNLTGATAVTAPSQPNITVSNFVPVSSTQVKATLHLAAATTVGAHAIEVIAPIGASNAVTFTVVAAPKLTGISPASGAPDTSVNVTLTGTNLTGATAVTAPSQPNITVSNFVPVSSTQVTATLHLAAATLPGAHAIEVITPAGASNTVTFTVVATPKLTGISPASGVSGASVSVTLTGTNLTGATAVTAPSQPNITVSNFVPVSSTQVTATLNVAAATLLGAHLVSVVTPAGTATIPFTVLGGKAAFTGPSPSLVTGTTTAHSGTITVTNTASATGATSGPITLTAGPAITKVGTAGGSFSITGGTCASGTIISPGGSCTIVATYTPSGTATATGNVTITATGLATATQTSANFSAN